ncbi:MAG: hypothetical protein GY810_28380 [Aureispira sp.]|nr:hypothetical protein [Aureispira sp.]
MVNTSAVLSVSSEKEPVAPVTYVFQITGEIYGETSDGIYEFPFTSSEADNLGKFYYDVSYTDAGGKTRTTNEGTIIFSQDIGK